ncbi:hypothetical protein ACN38_g8290, partial [Penicillium nordicum]
MPHGSAFSLSLLFILPSSSSISRYTFVALHQSPCRILSLDCVTPQGSNHGLQQVLQPRCAASPRRARAGRADVRQHECIRPKPRSEPRPKPHPEPQPKTASYSPTTADNSQQRYSSSRSCIQCSPATRLCRSASTSRTPPTPLPLPFTLLQRPLFFSKRASTEPTSQPVSISVSSSPPPPLPPTSK